MQWHRVAPDFEWDGSWRDLRVLGTSRADRQTVWQILRTLEPAPVFSVGGVAGAMPEHVDTAFDARATNPSLLSFEVGRIGFDRHFFTPGEIEFSLDPRQITGPAEAEALAGSVKRLGDVTGRPVILAYGGAQEAEIARFCPAADEVRWAAYHRP